MKKIVCYGMLILLLLLFTACAPQGDPAASVTPTAFQLTTASASACPVGSTPALSAAAVMPATTPKSVLGKTEYLSKLVFKPYKLECTTSYFLYMSVKNNAEEDLSVFVDVIFYDAVKNVVGSATASEVLEAGFETTMTLISEKDFESYEYSITIE